MANYLCQAQQKWAITAGRHRRVATPARRISRVTIAGTERVRWPRLPEGGELVVAPKPSRAGRNSCGGSTSWPTARWRIMPKSIPNSKEAMALSAVGSSFRDVVANSTPQVKNIVGCSRCPEHRSKTGNMHTNQQSIKGNHMIALRNLLMPALTAALLTCAAAQAQTNQNISTSVTRQQISTSLWRPASSTMAPSPDGFLQRWLVLEPIHANGLTDKIVQTTVKTEYFPNQFSVIPRDGDTVNVNGTNLVWHALDTARYNLDLYQFAHAYNKPSSDVLFWAVTIVNSPQEMTGVRLAIGSNAASVWWLNGREVIGIYGDRQTVIDDGVSKRLTLKKGPNIVRAAIVNGGGATDFCARFLDSKDQPIKDLTLTLDTAAK
jgi:hypothetical protein